MKIEEVSKGLDELFSKNPIGVKEGEWLYIMRFKDYVKIGKSTDPDTRLFSFLCTYLNSKNEPGNYRLDDLSPRELIKKFKISAVMIPDSGYLEKSIHTYLKDCRIPFEYKFDGMTECYPKELYDYFTDRYARERETSLIHSFTQALDVKQFYKDAHRSTGFTRTKAKNQDKALRKTQCQLTPEVIAVVKKLIIVHNANFEFRIELKNDELIITQK